MQNVTVQKRLFTKRRDDPEDAFKFALAFEQGVHQEKAIGVKPTNVKQVPVAAIEKNNEC